MGKRDTETETFRGIRAQQDRPPPPKKKKKNTTQFNVLDSPKVGS